MIPVREESNLLLLRGYKNALQLATTASNLREPPIDKDTAINVLSDYTNNLILSESQATFIEQLKSVLEISLFVDNTPINLIGALNSMLVLPENQPEYRQINIIYMNMISSINNNPRNINFYDSNTSKNSTNSPPNSQVVINGKLITDKQMEEMRRCFIEITGYQGLSSQELNILTDVVRAMDFIFKGGKLEYNFEDNIIPQWGFNLRSDPPTEEFLKNHRYQINNIAEAKKFIESKIHEIESKGDHKGQLVLENILEKIQLSDQAEIHRAGQILHFILYNKINKEIPNKEKLHNNRRYSL